MLMYMCRSYLPDPRSSSVGAMFIPAGEEARPSGEA